MSDLLLGAGEQWHRDQSGAGYNNSGNAMRWRMFLQQVGDRNESDVHGERQKTAPTILSVKRSFFSRLSSSETTDSRHSNATAEVTSIKLSTPKPTREILPEIIPVINAPSPSRLFHPMVKYSRRLPRWAMMAKSVELCGTTDFTFVWATKQSCFIGWPGCRDAIHLYAEQLTKATCSKLKV